MEQNIIHDQLHITKVRRVSETHLKKRYFPFSPVRNTHCFIYGMGGASLFQLDTGKEFLIGPGDMLYLSVGADYSMDIQTDIFDYFICCFDTNAAEHCQCFSLKIKTTQEVERVFRQLCRAFSVTDVARELMCLAELNRLYALIVQNASASYLPGSVKAKVEDARAYIQTHLVDPELCLADLAKRVGVSEAYFRRLFFDCYGLSPMKFLIHERIRCAKRLLELEKFPLADVAAQAGFTSLPYFCKVFKAQTGMTPAKYRKQYGE